MPLFDPQRETDIDPKDAIVAVHDFLLKCREWAQQREIPKRVQRVDAELDPAAAAQLHAWISYLRFTEHALEELENGTLDHWFSVPKDHG